MRDGGGRLGSKVGQIGPKWDKSGTYSDQILVQLARLAKGWIQGATGLSLSGAKDIKLKCVITFMLEVVRKYQEKMCL